VKPTPSKSSSHRIFNGEKALLLQIGCKFPIAMRAFRDPGGLLPVISEQPFSLP
jgi:hypothetical protein